MIDPFLNTIFKCECCSKPSINISIKNLSITIEEKQDPKETQINAIRNRVDRVKAKFENALRRKFNAWQRRVLVSFLEQMKDGASILIVKPHDKEDLTKTLTNHWQRVAETFAPKTKFTRVKAITENPIDGPAQTENDNVNDEFFIFGILNSIENNIQNLINGIGPSHINQIIDTTEVIGNSGKSISNGILQEAKVYISNKMAGRTTTVSVTETQWIAEGAQGVAIGVTTPIAGSATPNQLKILQSISPNARLRNEDIDDLFENGSPNAINKFRQQIANPQKVWLTMGDKRVRSSHAAVNGVTIGINQAFVLKGGLMLYPTDSSLGVSFGEIVGCRCHAIYL